MKFYEAPQGYAPAGNMSDSNSDGVSSDGGTPPEYNNNNHTPVVIYEVTTYSADDGIVLYPYDPNQNLPNAAEIGGEREGEPSQSPSSSYQYFESNEQDLGTVANLENLRSRLTNYMNATIVYESLRAPVLSGTDSDDSTNSETTNTSSMKIDDSPIEIDKNPPPPPSPRYNDL